MRTFLTVSLSALCGCWDLLPASRDPLRDTAALEARHAAIGALADGSSRVRHGDVKQAFSGWSDDQMKQHFNGMRYGDLKKQVAEMVLTHLGPFQQRYREITSEPGYLDRVLSEGAEHVAPIRWRNHDVQDDQLVVAGPRQREAGGAVCR